MTSAGAVGTLAAGVGVVAAIPLGVISLVTGAVGLIGSATQKMLLKKLEKHNRILALTEVKLSTIDRLVSKALKDNSISDDEFDAIQREFCDFRKIKREIQAKIRASSDTDMERLKQDLIEQGRQRGFLETKQLLNDLEKRRPPV